ncbi:MAG: sensor histidine kinase [Minwuia sp.]|uniref:sensor histidine kinase n=1 Tax=Minwuia sp. TaxID=2493630 RepID=UPI003A8AA579
MFSSPALFCTTVSAGIRPEFAALMEEPDFAIHPLTLRFRDRTVEAAFQTSWLRGTMPMRRFWAIGAILVYGLYSTLILGASAHGFADLHWFRFLVCLPILVLVAGVTVSGRATPTMLNTLFPIVTAAPFGNACFAYATTGGEESLLYLYEMASLFVCSIFYFPMLLVPLLMFIVIGTAMSFVTFWSVWLAAGQGWDAIAVQTMLLLGLTAAGIAAAYSKDTLVRRNYRASQMQQAARRDAEILARSAQAASEAKSRFMAILGHEFRTPLNAIIGYSELMRATTPPDALSAAKWPEYLDDIHHSAAKLHHQIENVLMLVRDDQSPLRLNAERFDLAVTASAVAARLQDRADQRSISLNAPGELPPVEITADRWMTERMVGELLTNAIKFSRAGSEISLSVGRGEGGVCLSVTDRGDGLDASALGTVFDPFVQTDDDLNRRNDGLGLGLSLVRKMIEAHGGRIELEPAEGGGTLARLFFPDAAPAA